MSTICHQKKESEDKSTSTAHGRFLSMLVPINDTLAVELGLLVTLMQQVHEKEQA